MHQVFLEIYDRELKMDDYVLFRRFRIKKKEFLAPYRGGPRYHLQQFQTSGPPRNQEETFYRLHSSLRSL